MSQVEMKRAGEDHEEENEELQALMAEERESQQEYEPLSHNQ